MPNFSVGRSRRQQIARMQLQTVGTYLLWIWKKGKTCLVFLDTTYPGRQWQVKFIEMRPHLAPNQYQPRSSRVGELWVAGTLESSMIEHEYCQGRIACWPWWDLSGCSQPNQNHSKLNQLCPAFSACPRNQKALTSVKSTGAPTADDQPDIVQYLWAVVNAAMPGSGSQVFKCQHMIYFGVLWTTRA